MKFLLQAMRLFHYMAGITAPEPKDERKVLLVWIAAILAILVIGAGFAWFIVLRIVR